MFNVLSWLDIGILALVAFAGLMGIVNGFLRQLAVLLSLISALIIIFTFGDVIIAYLDRFVPVNSISVLITYLLLLIATYIIVKLLFSLLCKCFGVTNEVSFLGRMGGLLVGVLYATFLLMILASMMEHSYFSNTDFWPESNLMPYLVQYGDYIYAYFPDVITDVLKATQEVIKE